MENKTDSGLDVIRSFKSSKAGTKMDVHGCLWSDGSHCQMTRTCRSLLALTQVRYLILTYVAACFMLWW